MGGRGGDLEGITGSTEGPVSGSLEHVQHREDFVEKQALPTRSIIRDRRLLL